MRGRRRPGGELDDRHGDRPADGQQPRFPITAICHGCGSPGVRAGRRAACCPGARESRQHLRSCPDRPPQEPRSTTPGRSPRFGHHRHRTCRFTRRFSAVPAVDDTVRLGLPPGAPWGSRQAPRTTVRGTAGIGPVLGRRSEAREAAGQQGRGHQTRASRPGRTGRSRRDGRARARLLQGENRMLLCEIRRGYRGGNRGEET